MARGFKPTPQEQDWFLQRLLADGFDSHQARKAELWILRGDWAFRGTMSRLEYSDFWPDTDKLRKLTDALDMVILAKGEHQYLIRQASATNTRTLAPVCDDHATIARMAQEILELKAELAELRRGMD